MKLSCLDAAPLRRQVVAVPPLGIDELRAIDDNLIQLDTLPRVNLSGDDIDPRAQSKHETVVLPVEDEVSACEQDLARGRNGHRRVGRRHNDPMERSGAERYCTGLPSSSDRQGI